MNQDPRDAAHWRFEISRDVKFDETLFPVKEVTKSRTLENDPPISTSDHESEQSGVEIVIPPQSSVKNYTALDEVSEVKEIQVVGYLYISWDWYQV